MDFITLVKGRDELRVRPRGLEQALANGWTVKEEPKPKAEPKTKRKANEVH